MLSALVLPQAVAGVLVSKPRFVEDEVERHTVVGVGER